ncbi:MAG: peptidoglycan/xylan/chitin deacetylase (PgdA/CDA1 family) [Bradymonadia bacterium]|jgi:peptidoglycan/xylan/chitin deacetylase (PgdA/CDA1 family)
MSLRSNAKRWLGSAVYASPLSARLWKDRAVIIAFHSIRDDAESPIICGVDLYHRFLDFFAAEFDVVSLEVLLDLLEEGACIDGKLVITFDDGYLDNATVAAPALKARGLPATFFVASDFVGSEHQTWWDQKVNVESRWMTWDHVRTLQDEGFDIGGHTSTHANLGVLRGAIAKREIDDGLSKIKRETGTRPTSFAFPYGMDSAICDSNRALIAEAGMRCCLGCGGGLVRPADDTFTLRRTAVSPWFDSPQQFGFELAKMALKRAVLERGDWRARQG